MREHVFAKNTSEIPQKLQHPLLRGAVFIPSMPGGFIPVRGNAIEIQPQQCVRLPMRVWNTGPSAYRRPWIAEIAEEEFMAAGADVAVTETPDSVTETPDSVTETPNAVVETAKPVNLDLAEAIARACHEANRAYCLAIGDDSQLAWEEAPDWQKDSAINGVRFFLANPEATPETMHEKWMEQKAAEGWTYGEIKDADAKTHPCMVPYAELPQAQRVKDEIFQATIRSSLALLASIITPGETVEMPKAIRIEVETPRVPDPANPKADDIFWKNPPGEVCWVTKVTDKRVYFTSDKHDEMYLPKEDWPNVATPYQPEVEVKTDTPTEDGAPANED